MYVAFASSNGELIDQHFGWSKAFYLYEIDNSSSNFVKILDSSNEPEEEKAKLNYKIGTLEDADIVYCTQIGPTASKMVQAAGIHPARVAEGEKITDAIEQLQGMLNDNPPIWLLRIFHRAQKREA